MTPLNPDTPPGTKIPRKRTKPKSHRIGRPPVEVDEKLIRAYAEAFHTLAEIAARVGCSVDTLRSRFSHVIREGRETGQGNLRLLQLKRARAGSDRMLTWLGIQYLGQKERVENVSPTITAEEHLKAIREQRAERLSEAANVTEAPVILDADGNGVPVN